MAASILSFIAGLVLLIVGAEALVRGASRIALQLGISPLVVGLTIVSIGTGSPEIAVGLQSALSGNADLAVGNVVGSNIFNILAVLGVSALFSPLVVSRQLIRLDVPIMLIASALTLALGWDGSISRLDGAVLFGLLIGYIFWLLRQAKSSSPRDQALTLARPTPLDWRSAARNPAMIVIGLISLITGSNLLVDSAVQFAHFLGVSDVIIGLTVVAAGTSLPELVTSILATIRGEREIAVGNAIGSNIFNLLGVLGLSAMVAPGGLPVAVNLRAFDLPVMFAVALACLPILFNNYRIARWEGAMFAGYYIAYTIFLVLTALHSLTAPIFGQVMLFFVLPLTIVTIGVVVIRSVRSGNA